MGIAVYDVIDDFINMINDNWGSSGDVGITPRLEKIWEEKRVGFVDDRRDIVVIEPVDESIKYFGLYGSDFLHSPLIKIDIRSYQDSVRHNDIVNEISRIIKSQIRRTNYVDVRLVSSKSLNSIYRNLFRHVLEVRYRKLNP
jgi:hypothetical protein